MEQRSPQFGLLSLGFFLAVFFLTLGVMLTLIPNGKPPRRANRALECLSKMNNLGKAMIAYERRQGHYPGYKNVQAERSYPIAERGPLGPGPRIRPAYPQSSSWLVPLFFYIDRADLAEQYGPEAPDTPGSFRACPVMLDQPMQIMICPSDTVAADEGVYASSYVVNAGMEDLHGPINWDQVGGDVLTSPDEIANGVFHYRYPFTGNDNLRSTHSSRPVRQLRVSSDNLLAGDGLTTTLLMTENVDGGLWTDEREYLAGVVWEPEAATPPGALNSEAKSRVKRPNEDIGGRTRANSRMLSHYLWARPSSFHTNGFNAIFADGHGRFIVETIDPIVWAQLMSVNGKKAAWPRPVGRPRELVVETVGPAGNYSAYGQPVERDSF